MIKLMIVDDQRLVREGLEALIEMHEGMECLAVFENGQKLIEGFGEIKPDVILMDIRMPILDGIEATKIIKQSHPQVRVLMLTTFDDDDYIINAMKAGANGYILKDTPFEDLDEAIRTVIREGAYLMDTLTSKVIKHIHSSQTLQPQIEMSWASKYHLTNRELETIHFLKRGFSNQEIAEELYISPGTVKNHVANIMEKLELRDRSHIVIYALTGERPDRRSI